MFDAATRLARYFEAQGPEGLVSAYLFGSEARGSAHRESDVDVALLLDRERFESEESRFEARLSFMADLPGASPTVRSTSSS